MDRYILKEFAGPFVLYACGFTIMLLSGLLFELTDLILVKRAAVSLVLRMLLYRLPSLIVMTLPIAVLFGTLTALGRLAKDGELTVIRGCGRSYFRIGAPLIIGGLLVSLFTLWVNEQVVPHTNHAYETLVRRLVFQEVMPVVREDLFFRGPDGRFFYIEEVDPTTRSLLGILILESREDRLPRMITAREGTYEGDQWILMDGVQREFDEQGFISTETGFQRLVIQIPQRVETYFGKQKTTEEMNRRELARHIRLFSQSGINVRPFLVDYHVKLALPLSSFIFVLLATPLSLFSPRGGKFFGIAASLAIAFLYYICTSVCRSLGINGALPPLLAAWLPNILGLFFTIILFRRVEGL
ncbi:MAG: LptF/LptG family permease [Limnochordia bacterium]